MKRKRIITACITALILALSTGCGNDQNAESENSTLPTPEITDESNELQDQDNEPQDQDAGITDKTDEDTPPAAEPPANDPISDTTPEPDANTVPDATFIGGNVKSISQDSFVISRTIMDSDGNILKMPDEGGPDEELVTIRCTDTTVYEHWTIQGGGAGIDMEEASFSDISVDDGLEASGYFDGEEFIAQKVIIEVYQ